MGQVNDLGNSINMANAVALQSMINLAQSAAGKDITVNDVALGTAQYTWNGDNWTDKDGATVNDSGLIKRLNEAAGGTSMLEDGTTATVIQDTVVKIGESVLAGGLVELQFKIDQMMAAVQEGIKNTGKVSQTREGAARA